MWKDILLFFSLLGGAPRAAGPKFDVGLPVPSSQKKMTKTMQNNKNMLMCVPYVIVLAYGSISVLPFLTQFAVKSVFVCHLLKCDFTTKYQELRTIIDVWVCTPLPIFEVRFVVPCLPWRCQSAESRFFDSRREVRISSATLYGGRRRHSLPLLRLRVLGVCFSVSSSLSLSLFVQHLRDRPRVCSSDEKNLSTVHAVTWLVACSTW